MRLQSGVIQILKRLYPGIKKELESDANKSLDVDGLAAWLEQKFGNSPFTMQPMNNKYLPYVNTRSDWVTPDSITDGEVEHSDSDDVKGKGTDD